MFAIGESRWKTGIVGLGLLAAVVTGAGCSSGGSSGDNRYDLTGPNGELFDTITAVRSGSQLVTTSIDTFDDDGDGDTTDTITATFDAVTGWIRSSIPAPDDRARGVPRARRRATRRARGPHSGMQPAEEPKESAEEAAEKMEEAAEATEDAAEAVADAAEEATEDAAEAAEDEVGEAAAEVRAEIKEATDE